MGRDDFWICGSKDVGLFLASVLFLHPAVKLIRSATGYGEGLPVVTADDLSDVYDLSDMVGVVGQLAIDSIDGQQWFVAYVDGTQQVVCGQAAQGAQQAVPSLIPLFDQLVAGRMFSLQAEFGLSVPVRFFSVFLRKLVHLLIILPLRCRIMMAMLLEASLGA